jgi:hypothetical protein
MVGLGQGYSVDDGVQPPISSPTKPMSDDPSGRRFNGRHASIGRQLSVATKSLPRPQNPGQRSRGQQVYPAQSGQWQGMLGGLFLKRLV